MARVNFELLDWDDYMPHYKDLEFQEHKDNSDFKKGLDEIRDYLNATFGTRTVSSSQLAETVSLYAASLYGTDVPQEISNKKVVLNKNLLDTNVPKIKIDQNVLSKVYKESDFDLETLEIDENDRINYKKEVLSDIEVSNLFDKKVKFSKTKAELHQESIKFLKSLNEVDEKKIEFLNSQINFGKIENKEVESTPNPNFSVASLLSQMPLFYENMYTAFFTVSDGVFDDLYTIGQNKEIKDRLDYKHIIDCFGVNLSEFEVPQPKNNTYSVKFLDREIKKVSTSFELPHRVEMTFDVDQMAMLAQNFQILSYGGQGNNSKLELTPVEDNKYYAQQFFPAMFKNRTNKIKIYVMFNNMAEHYGNVIQTKDSKNNIRNGKNQIIGTENSYKAFVFENVQFLGITNNLEFNRDSVSSLKLTVAFRFQTLKEFDNNRIN